MRQTIARTREKQKARKAKDQAENVVRKFRPRKSERGSFVYVGVKGGRVRFNEKRRAVLLFITKTGKKQIVRERKRGKKLSAVKFRAASSYNVGKIAGKVGAKKKFFEGRLQKQMEPEILRGKNIQWERFVKLAGAKLKKVRGNRQTNAVIQVKVEITVQFFEDDNSLETHSFTFQWNAKALQKLDDINFQEFFWSTVYAEFAQRLRTGRQVTAGSFQRVERANIGKENIPSNWRWQGKLWGKSSYEKVKIVRIKFELFKLKIVSK